MAEKNTRAERISIIFAAHPEQSALYFTSDDQAFYKIGDAKAHAEKLPNKNVETISRDGKVVSEKSTIKKEAKTTQIKITKEDLDNNPDLKEEGINAGDSIEVVEVKQA